MRRFAVWSIVASLVTGACGGRTIEPEENPNDDALSNAGGESGGGTGPNGQVSLPPCELGFFEADEPGQDCQWQTVDQRCYDSKIAACACACRETAGDYCLSPLIDAPETRIPVECF